MPIFLYQHPGVAISFKADNSSASRRGILDYSPEIRREFNGPAWLELCAGSHEGFESRAGWVEVKAWADQKYFGGGPGRFTPNEPPRKYSRLVKNEGIARRQVVNQVMKLPIDERSARFYDQHPAGVSNRGRP